MLLINIEKFEKLKLLKAVLMDVDFKAVSKFCKIITIR